ncbi:MAG TPA: cupredoxin domain-containing protein [Thermomicrobiaceae bacterium]|nr:cupredoxin domain-containing protein [Thermomicrobiaceae bacterium]
MLARLGIRLALALLAVAVLGGCSRSGATPIPTESTGPVVTPITVVMTEMLFTPSAFTVPVGSKVVVTLKNQGVVPHDFTIDNVGGQQVQQVVPAGQTTTVTFLAPTQPGQLTFYCSQPGHRQAGMQGTITVQ